MKFNVIWYLFITLLFLSCNNDDDLVGSDRYNINIGTYTLLKESIDALPYSGFQAVQFRDSIGNTTELRIEESPSSIWGPITFYEHDVYDWGDTVTYTFSREQKIVRFKSDDIDLSMSLIMYAIPFWPDPVSRKVADIVQIYKGPHSGTSLSSVWVFSDVMNKRTWDSELTTADNIGIKEFYGREFNDVKINGSGGLTKMHFNDDLGIIFFNDNEGKGWRFEKFIE